MKPEDALRAWLDGKPREAAFLWEKLAAALPQLPNWPTNLAFAADTRGEFLKAEKIAADAWTRGARTCLRRIAIHFGAKGPADVLHAQYLAGVPGVELFPVEGLRDHDSLPWVLRQQPDVLSRFVENVREDRN
jgi:hypothetical protein